MSAERAVRLGPGGHALLFAYLAQEAERTLGPVPADGLIHAAVWRYGRERGGRMAQRAQQLGVALDWAAYLALGEWSAPDAPHERVDLERTPQMHGQVLRCPWNDAWQAESLARYGRLYCRDIDQALVNGFNPDMRYEVSQTLPAGDACCDFVSVDYAFTGAEEARLAALRERVGTTATMPWPYHLAHLYWSIRREFEAHTGAAGTAIAERALARFGEHTGHDTAEAIRSDSATDFCIAQ